MRTRPLPVRYPVAAGKPGCGELGNANQAHRSMIGGRLLLACSRTGRVGDEYTMVYDLRNGQREILPARISGVGASNFGYLGRYWAVDATHGLYFNLRSRRVRSSSQPMDIDRSGFQRLAGCPNLGLPTILADETRVFASPYAVAAAGQGNARRLYLFRCHRPAITLGAPAYRVGISDGLAWADAGDVSRVYDIPRHRLYRWHVSGRSGYLQYTEVTRYRVFVLKAELEVLIAPFNQLTPVAFTIYTTRLKR